MVGGEAPVQKGRERTHILDGGGGGYRAVLGVEFGEEFREGGRELI